MIGRTAPANPWIFRQIAEFGATGAYTQPTPADRYAMIRTYFAMMVEEETHGIEGKMKQFVTWFTHGITGGGALRKAVYKNRTGPEILASVDEFFERLLSGNADEVAAFGNKEATAELEAGDPLPSLDGCDLACAG